MDEEDELELALEDELERALEMEEGECHVSHDLSNLLHVYGLLSQGLHNP